ncbi:hypothetical protein [Microlunatus sp. GCM10028923]|uniref:hypothetical protein n=1 Tax=Microlunatus sp. GCM10028923 TaxID=3273400 RepID=UPI00362408A7
MKIIRRGHVVAVLLLIMGGMTACSGQELGPVAKSADAPSVESVTAEYLDQAFRAVSEKVGAGPVQVTDISIQESGVQINAVNPQAPSELNLWTYQDGRVMDPRPVDYGGDTEALEQNLFSMGDVEIATVVALIKEAPAASKIDSARTVNVEISRGLPITEDIEINVAVASERDQKQVRANLSGKIIKVL